MQVSLTATGGLERRLEVAIPAAEVDGEVANRIELGQCKAGLVVSCETAREINETAIDTVNQSKSLDVFRSSLATFTGGSGAVAVLVT